MGGSNKSLDILIAPPLQKAQPFSAPHIVLANVWAREGQASFPSISMGEDEVWEGMAFSQGTVCITGQLGQGSRALAFCKLLVTNEPAAYKYPRSRP